MPPKRVCSSSGHTDSSGELSDNVHRIDGKKYQKKVIDHLINQGLIKPYHSFLCENCYKNGQDEIAERYTIDEICEMISSGGFEVDETIALSSAFGNLMRKKLVCVESLTDISFIQTLNASNNLDNIDKVVLSFLNAIALNENDKKVKILNAYEHLVNLSVSKYIGPLNFSLNLISYFISGSRNIVELGSRYSPAGSYKFVTEYLRKNSSESLELPPKTDVAVFFDNNQIMARNWNVQYNSKALISVITTMISLVPPVDTNLQQNPQLKPTTWLNSIDLKDTADENKDRMFRSERNKYILRSIESIHDEILKTNDAPIAKKPKVDSKKDPYDHIESFVAGKTEVKLMDPVMVNPCSYNSLETVMDDIVAKCDREWVLIGCDGLPYVLCSKIVDNYHLCPTCSELFKKKDLFLKHLNVHPVDDVNKCRKYGNILLLPGLGHMEINLTKAMFKLLWKVVLKDLAVMLGWKSIKALTACEKCTDHHKAWQILQILFSAGTRSLLKPFIHHCIETKTSPSLSALYKYLSQQSPNYIFLYKCIFTFIFAINLFRSSVRRGNFNLLSVALHKLTVLFYGLNMTSYMEITLRYENILKKAPQEIKTFISKTITCSQSGHPSKAEGGDFILESVNKKVKSWMPPGVPTEDRWMRVCRNLPSMDNIKRNLEQKLGEGEDQPANPYFR